MILYFVFQVGTPGCGKTLMISILANILNYFLIIVTSGDLQSSWRGNSSHNKIVFLMKISQPHTTSNHDQFILTYENQPIVLFLLSYCKVRVH